MKVLVYSVGQCGFEEWSREHHAIRPCAKPSVAIAGDTPLCRDHFDFFCQQTDSVFIDDKGERVTMDDFRKLVGA